MAKILVGGPEGQHQDIHDDLVTRLKQEYDVTYIKNDEQTMLWELAKTPLVPKEKRYNLVLYDSDLFHPGAKPGQKIEYFEAITAIYLASTQAPVIILAEYDLAVNLRPSAEKAGFMQIDEPYNLDRIVRDIKGILETKTADSDVK
ncbi:hypothetical protein HY494_02305 [Candidatus Woesearchaeota archaeon]|nr:hypothetical protein [Candidatus Woesearchaeota archaeon]